MNPFTPATICAKLAPQCSIACLGFTESLDSALKPMEMAMWGITIASLTVKTGCLATEILHRRCRSQETPVQISSNFPLLVPRGVADRGKGPKGCFRILRVINHNLPTAESISAVLATGLHLGRNLLSTTSTCLSVATACNTFCLGWLSPIWPGSFE